MVVFFGFKSGTPFRFTRGRSPRRLGSEARKKMSARGGVGVRNLKHRTFRTSQRFCIECLGGPPYRSAALACVCHTVFLHLLQLVGIHHLRAARAGASQAGILSERPSSEAGAAACRG
jgi:hypothetical protein